jgi:hypothetical protein
MANVSFREAGSFCPSAQPDWEDSVAIGVMEGTAEKPRLVHFASALPVSQQLLDLSESVTPTEVFRFAAPCMNGRCVHYGNSKCGLVTQIVKLLPSVAEALPTCAIRPTCRWWQQEGKSACLRCSQVVTDNYNPSPEMRIAATPQLSRFGKDNSVCEEANAKDSALDE